MSPQTTFSIRNSAANLDYKSAAFAVIYLSVSRTAVTACIKYIEVLLTFFNRRQKQHSESKTTTTTLRAGVWPEIPFQSRIFSARVSLSVL